MVDCCEECPYCYLKDKQLTLENNNSDVLLIFQSPGMDEWENNKPLSSDNPHSTAKRMENSFLGKS